MTKKFETSRLSFEPVSAGSLKELVRFHTDEEVMKFIGTGQILSESVSLEVLGRYLTQECDHPALGAWLIYTKDSRRLCGSAILRKPMTNEKMDGLEIGYMFFPDFWGQGFATEVAQGLVDYGLRETGCKEYVAMVRPGNEGSVKVLLKAKFVASGKLPYTDPKTQNLVDLDFFTLKVEADD